MAAALAQGLDPAALLKPPTDTWPTYNGDYTGRRYSPLKQINSSNIKSLTLAWAFQANSQAIKSTPLEVNGILYFTVPEHVWAIDARTGRQVWHYHYKSNRTAITSAIAAWACGATGCTSKRRTRTWSAWTPRTATCAGTSSWPTCKLGYFATMAPLVVGNHVIAGVSGRRHRYPRISRVGRPGDRQAAMALVHRAEAGRAGLGNLAEEQRCHHAWRRHDLDDRHLRSRR